MPVHLRASRWLGFCLSPLKPLAAEPARCSALCGWVGRAVQDGWTALHHAASDGDVVVVRALLEGGASRKIKNEVCASLLVAWPF